MKLAVFGATGKTGRLLVDRALSEGHEVKALVRGAKARLDEHLRLEIVVGDADQHDAVREAVAGADAVISTMGSGKGTLTRFGQNVLPAMEAAGVNRLVSLVGAAVSVPGDTLSLGRTIMLSVMKLLAWGVLADAEAHARLLEASTLSYTLVRPPRLTNGPATARIRHARALALGPSSLISRADLAAFMLQVTTEGLYRREAPMVASEA